MSQLKIEKVVTLDGIERLYTKLYGVSKREIDLVVSLEIDAQLFFEFSSLVQFVFTWIRYSESGKLILDTDSRKDSFAAKIELMQHAHFYPLTFTMAWHRGIVDKNGIDIKYLLKPVNEKWHKKMDMLTTDAQSYRGALFFSCFDHLPTEKGLLRAFYSNKKFYPDEPSFLLSPFADLASNFLQSQTYGVRTAIKDDYEQLMGVAFELMKNTDEWATTNERMRSLSPNSRAILIRQHRKNLNEYRAEYRDDRTLSRFFNDSFVTNDINQLYAVELSVMDSGPGLVRRFNGSLPEQHNLEVDIIKKCLTKHMTTATGHIKIQKGNGLDRVLRLINHNGILRIRTGSIAAYRNLRTHPYREHSNVEEIELFDWESSSSDEFTKFNVAEGTLLSIIYPINRRWNR